jgi:hypothetical protein
VLAETRIMINLITYCKIILHFDLQNSKGWCYITLLCK